MKTVSQVLVYFDYKSPYAFLAKDRVYQLAEETGAAVEWRPYVLNVAGYLGDAKIAADGTVEQSNRTPHQWRRVRYMFMDCRRQAKKRGLILRATQKLFDSRLAAAGMLFARADSETVFRRYHDMVFERFWQRQLDIEDVSALAAVLTEAGGDGTRFPSYLPEGLAEVEAIARAAEDVGVFGVPTFIVNGEMFWGNEHLPDIQAMLTESPRTAA